MRRPARRRAGSRPASARIRLDEAGTLNLKSGAGDISVDRATGHAEITAGSGDVRLRELDGSAVIKNSNGDTWIGVAAGDLRVNAANGNIAVDLAQADVGAKSANGDVRLGEVVRGSVVLETQIGDLEVGIREGTAAWLDVNARPARAQRARRPPTPPAGVRSDRRGARPHLRRRDRDPAPLTSGDRPEHTKPPGTHKVPVKMGAVLRPCCAAVPGAVYPSGTSRAPWANGKIRTMQLFNAVGRHDEGVLVPLADQLAARPRRKRREEPCGRAAVLEQVAIAGAGDAVLCRLRCVTFEVRRLLLRSGSPQAAERNGGQPVPERHGAFPV